MNEILHGDSLDVLKTLPADSVDLLCTDPPYGIGFMGKEWDTFKPEMLAKGVARSSRKDTTLKHPESRDKGSAAMESARYDHSPAGAIKFREWLHDHSVEWMRVLKPGAFAFVCMGARQDSVAAAIVGMTEAGFKTDFTSLFWTYASGFPKAMNVSKAVDKRAGAVRKGEVKRGSGTPGNTFPLSHEYETGEAVTSEAKALEGAYGGFQPKPAVEVIVVAMKPLSEKSYVDQALKNKKGVTWLDDARIPAPEGRPLRVADYKDTNNNTYQGRIDGSLMGGSLAAGETDMGRFPANLLVSEAILGDYSRFFSLGDWAKTLPFLAVTKANQDERNKGLDDFPITNSNRENAALTSAENRTGATRNPHPTVKPLDLMSYLIVLGSRPGDVVLDPFSGSGTTCVAAKELGRDYIGIERELEYVNIGRSRLVAVHPTLL